MNPSREGISPGALAGLASFVGGLLALIAPFFEGLAEAGAALAAVAWLPRAEAELRRGAGGSHRTAVVLTAGLLVAAWATRLFARPPWDRPSSVLLGAASLLLARWPGAPEPARGSVAGAP